MIAGLNTDIGIMRTGGKKELYLETLSVFGQDAVERVEEIEKSLASGNYDLYSIHVHGIKSALTLIGADILSQIAQDLETAGDKQDVEFINAHNDVFIELLNSLCESIFAYLQAHTTENVVDTETLIEGLVELKTAIDSFEASDMHRITNHLLKITKGTDKNKTIRKISNDILVCEYDEAMIMINSFLREL